VQRYEISLTRDGKSEKVGYDHVESELHWHVEGIAHDHVFQITRRDEPAPADAPDGPVEKFHAVVSSTWGGSDPRETALDEARSALRQLDCTGEEVVETDAMPGVVEVQVCRDGVAICYLLIGEHTRQLIDEWYTEPSSLRFPPVEAHLSGGSCPGARKDLPDARALRAELVELDERVEECGVHAFRKIDVVARVELRANGRVKSVEVPEIPGPDALRRCVAKAVRSFRGPEFSGKPLRFSLVFWIKPKEQSDG
jgi:hypothetical protein